MPCIIYVRQNDTKSLYFQYNKCAEFAQRNGYSISGKVLDFNGKNFHEAANKVIANSENFALIIYSFEDAFNDYDESLFYRIYFEKLGKQIISVN